MHVLNYKLPLTHEDPARALFVSGDISSEEWALWYIWFPCHSTLCSMESLWFCQVWSRL